MAYCQYCGKELIEDSNFCDGCGAQVIPAETQVIAPKYESHTDKAFVVLSENEIRVKTYHCTTLKRPKGDGYVTVTNKRVVFHGHGSASKLVSEVPIETVSGISSYYGSSLKILFIILGAICALYFFTTIENFGFTSILSLAFAAMFFYFCQQVTYNLTIFSSGASSTPINIGNGTLGSMVVGQGAALTVVAKPTRETEHMMNEIGAIILDFKTMGDHALDKWAPGSKKPISSYQPNTNLGNPDDEEFFK